MKYKKGKYYIEYSSLDEGDWFLHLIGKGWINWNEFMPAYMQALTNAGYTEIKQRILY